MAQTIKLKRSATSGGVPSTSSLALGEVAINTTDGKMYIKKSVSGTESVVEIGGASSISSSFNLYEYTASNAQTTFSGADANSNTLAYDQAVGSVLPKVFVYLNGILLDHTTDYTATSGTSVVLVSGAATGDILSIGAYVSSTSISSDLTFSDNQKAIFGTGNDLQLYHSGSKSYIKDAGTGNMAILTNTLELNNAADSQNMIVANEGGAVTLHHSGSAKLATSATGISVTGTIAGGTATASGGTNTTALASTAFVQQEITTLIGGAPSTLNDLNELAAAINDDANYNSTLTTALATKLPLAGGTMTGNIAHAGDFTLDVGGEINLDADGGKVRFKDAGIDIGFVSFANTDLTFYSSVQDRDLIFQGNDGGSAITALTLDMSEAGTATFNHDIKLGDNGRIELGVGTDLVLTSDGTHGYCTVDNGNLTFDVAGNIKLDADSSNIYLADGGTDIGLLSTNNQDLTIRNLITNKDINFQLSNGGTNFTALSLDANLAGAATFAGDVSVPNISVADDIRHSGDSDTYISFEQNHQGFYSGGTRALDIAAGSVVFNEGGGDVDFRVESTNNTHALFVQGSDGKVGIGETSPDGLLHLKGGTATGDASHILFENTQGSKVFAIGGGATGITNSNLFFRNVTDNTRPMVITNAGNVGIGTDAPAAKLEVKGLNSSSTADWGNKTIMSSVAINAANRTYGGLIMTDHGSGSGHAGLGFRYDGTGYKLELGTAATTNSGISTHLTIDRLGAITTSSHLTVGGDITQTSGDTLYTNNTNWDIKHTGASQNILFSTTPSGGSPTERVRIQSNGDVLIGKSSIALTSAGFAATPNDFMSYTNTSTSAGDRCLLLNRQSANGALIEFRKANAIAGTIGVFGVQPYFAGPNSNTGGIRLDSTSSYGVVIPTTTTGANRDAATDLGYSSGGTNVRFRDLYLSGTATAASITLPDAMHKSDTATLATVTQTAIATFPKATYGAAKFIVTAKDGVNRQISEILVTHNGSTAIATEYGTIVTAGTLATYDVDISGANVRLLTTGSSINSTIYKIVETLIEA